MRKGNVLIKNGEHFRLNILKPIAFIPIFFILVILIRLFVFEVFKVSSSSMLGALEENDIVLVNKLEYGPKLPGSIKEIPFVDALINIVGFGDWARSVVWKYRRFSGYGKIQRDDIIVFNRNNESDFYVKRCIGLPGETLEIRHTSLFINSLYQAEPEFIKLSYKVSSRSGEIPPDTLLKYGIKPSDIRWKNNKDIHVCATKMQISQLKKCLVVTDTDVDDFPAGSFKPHLFPHQNQFNYSSENYGPIVIPQKNKKINLDTNNIKIYEQVITQYEHNKLTLDQGHIYINDLQASSYKFKMDYYFVMGDNRYHSIDSRYWGFLPESYVLGKVIKITSK